ncbi:MAG: heparan-alpha-glucosaminide N-acetyltransferase domain-containing protein [Clostridia bacterium]|nr:heparan-alpha-glucosaminide N-acetyltransferase domain-containing protein [Clostridia bacterium]
MLSGHIKTSVIKCENPRNCFLENLAPYKRPRIWEMDFIRGFCILMMIIDHTMYLLAYTFGFEWYGMRPVAGTSFGIDLTLFSRWYWNCQARDIIHPIILFFFFSISGISCYFSRSNLKRGLELAGFAILYTMLTYYLQFDMGVSGSWVHFGVLNMLATCVLMYVAISEIIKFTTKNPNYRKWLLSGICFLIFLVIILMYYLYIPPQNTPKWLFFLFPPNLYFTQNEVSPGDFFPMIPWSAFFFFGAAVAPILYNKRKSLLPFLDHKWHYPVTFVGKHTLIIYLLHMIFLIALFALVSFLFVTPGNWIIF